MRKAHPGATEQDILDHLYDHVTEDIDTLFSLSAKHVTVQAFLESFEKVVKNFVKKKSGSKGTPSVFSIEVSSAKDEVRRVDSSDNCHICNKPNHLARECYSLTNATTRLMQEYNDLDAKTIYAVLVKGQRNNHPAFEKYRSNPKAYTARLSRGPNDNSGNYRQQQPRGSNQGARGGRTYNKQRQQNYGNGNGGGYSRGNNNYRRNDQDQEQPNSSANAEAAPSKEKEKTRVSGCSGQPDAPTAINPSQRSEREKVPQESQVT